MIRTIPVAADLLGLVAAGQPEPLMEWAEDGGRRVLTDRQEKDGHRNDCDQTCTRHTGDPLWTAYVMSTAADRPEVLQIRIPARQQPVLTVFAPVAVDNLEVNVRVGRDGKLAQYWAGAGIRDGAPAGRRNGHAESKQTEGQPA